MLGGGVNMRKLQICIKDIKEKKKIHCHRGVSSLNKGGGVKPPQGM